MEKVGIICHSNSPWTSLLHLDPLLNIQSLNNHMAGCTIFSKIDLVKAYHQIPIAKADIPKTAIATLSACGNFCSWLLVSEMWPRHSSGSKTISVCFPF